MQSLYPTVQFYDTLPVGTPTYKCDYSEVPDLTGFFGFVCCDIHPTKYLHHPVLVELKDSKLVADLYPKK